MPDTPEALADNTIHDLDAAVTNIIETFRIDRGARLNILTDAVLVEEAYRRLGNFVELIRPKKEAA